MAVQVHPDIPLIVAANRDEFHARPAAAADYWQDHPRVLAGRDLEAGGTWLGMATSGRFAAVTNFSETPPEPLPPRSRGDLVSDFLAGDEAPQPYLQTVAAHAREYRGFNLLAGHWSDLWYYSNRIAEPQRLPPGTYGLSNHLLDTAWPKVRRGKSALAAFEEAEKHPDVDELLELLVDETRPADRELIEAGLQPEVARRVAPCFIRGPVYGTRASTVVLWHRSGRVQFTEVRFNERGRAQGRSDFDFQLQERPTDDGGAGGRHGRR